MWVSNISTVSLWLPDVNIEQNMSRELSGRKHYVSLMGLHSRCLAVFYQQILNNANAKEVTHSVLYYFFHNIN